MTIINAHCIMHRLRITQCALITVIELYITKHLLSLLSTIIYGVQLLLYIGEGVCKKTFNEVKNVNGRVIYMGKAR